MKRLIFDHCGRNMRSLGITGNPLKLIASQNMISRFNGSSKTDSDTNEKKKESFVSNTEQKDQKSIVNDRLLGIPRLGILLTVAGIMPLAAPHILPQFLVNTYMESIVNAQLSYATVLLPFLGAINCGLAMSNYHRVNSNMRTANLNWMQYISSLFPLLVSWMSIHVQDDSSAVWLLMGGFSLILLLNIFCWFARLVPTYYLLLHMFFTALAIGFLFLTFVKYIKEKIVITENIQPILENKSKIHVITKKGNDNTTEYPADADVVIVDVKKPSELPKQTIFFHNENPQSEQKDGPSI